RVRQPSRRGSSPSHANERDTEDRCRCHRRASEPGIGRPLVPLGRWRSALVSASPDRRTGPPASPRRDEFASCCGEAEPRAQLTRSSCLSQSLRLIKRKHRAQLVDKGPGIPRRNILLQAIQTLGFATQSNTREEPAEQDVVAWLGHRRSAIPTNPYG